MGTGKVKKLGGVRSEGKGKIAEITLEAKKEIGRQILAGEVSVKTVQKEYAVSPQAVGWWKRLAEREDAETKAIFDEKELPWVGKIKVVDLVDEEEPKH
jgi:hypothetical protein